MGKMINFMNTNLSSPQLIGNKAYNLSTLKRNGFNIPDGFIIPSNICTNYLTSLGIDTNFQDTNIDNNQLKNKIINGVLKEEIKNEICDTALKYELVAIRSSGTLEDDNSNSFAGMYDSYIAIDPNDDELLMTNIKKCWGSIYNTRVYEYRKIKKINSLEHMAVIIMDMIPSEYSGVVFTNDPDKKNKNIIIETTYGLGDVLVSGEITPDYYVINRKEDIIIKEEISKKKIVKTIENKRIIEEGNKSTQPIEKSILYNLKNICLEIEEFFGKPQDIEWCYSNNKIWILQSRPLIDW